MSKSKNIFWQRNHITQTDRQNRMGHLSFCLWFTGLSGSGKSCLARETEKFLFERNISTYLLDGDNVRHGLNRDLGFSAEDRSENIRRIGEVCRLFVDAGMVVISAFISPYSKDRNKVRDLLGKRNFIEIYVEANLETCERRDVKGLYKKAREGEIIDFTGVSAPYEPPLIPELVINTTEESDILINTNKIIKYLNDNKYIKI